MGERMTLNVEQRMVEDRAQFRTGKLQHFGDQEERGRRLALQVNLGHRAHAVQKFGDMGRRVAESVLRPVPPGVYRLRVIRGHIIGHCMPRFRLRREKREILIPSIFCLAFRSLHDVEFARKCVRHTFLCLLTIRTATHG